MIAYCSTVAALLIAVVGCGYLIAATILVGRFARVPMPTSLAAPAVTILKPLHGDEQGLFGNLLSFAQQRYAGPVQIVCGVADARDPAIAAVERLRTAPAASTVELVVDPRSEERRVGKEG